MPSETLLKNKLADFVIGNNFDKSSYRYPMTLLSKIIESYGYSVSYNDPYSGGHITKTNSSLDKNISGTVEIIKHPDVKRMLMEMRSQTEAMRGLTITTGNFIDKYKNFPNSSEGKESLFISTL